MTPEQEAAIRGRDRSWACPTQEDDQAAYEDRRRLLTAYDEQAREIERLRGDLEAERSNSQRIMQELKIPIGSA